jgi:putative sigma-54 modulation protein
MSIEVTARHMDMKASLKEYAEGKAEEIMDEFPRIEYVHVILDKEKHRNTAEIFVQARRHARLEAKETSKDMHASIDAAMHKIEKRLRKLTEKSHDHKTVMKRTESARTKGLKA